MLLRLFLSFLKIGAFTFGGGYAMIPLIEREVIERKKWIAREEFLDLLTLAQSAPGPISLNTAVFVGYKLCGYSGALAAILGTILPSFTIILMIALFFREVRHNVWVDAAFRGMRPAVVALIVYPVVKLARGMHLAMLLVIIGSALAIWYLGWSPVLLLALGGVGGICWELIQIRKGGVR
ncbi:MAG: chromate transporter [Rikenellaceae bacterium]|nr:chromate transporter [Rikenellaceae bacterium]